MKTLITKTKWLLPIVIVFFLGVISQAQTTPSDNSAGISVTTNFSWTFNTANGTDDYFQVSTNNSFTDVVIDKQLAANATSYTFNSSDLTGSLSGGSNFNYNTTYYWRIYNKNTSSVDEPTLSPNYYTFKTQFSLTSPANGQTGVSIQPNLSWQSTTANYSLSISKNSNMSSPVLTKTGITTNSYNLTESEKLDNNTTYYWKVTDGTSNISGINQFKTAPSISLTLSNPADNSTGVSPNYVMFTWYSGSFGSGLKYYLEYDEGSTTFSTADFSVVTSNNYYTKTSLAENTDYAWRVIAFIDDGDGNFETDQDVIVSYSSVFTFKTAGGTSINAIPSYPTGGVTVYTNTPTLYWYLDYYSSNVKFKVEISTTNSSGGIFKTYDDITNLYKSVPGGDLSGGNTYYWRVTVKYNNSYGTPSSWAEFKTQGSGALLTPTPSYPTNNLTVYSTSPMLYWYVNGVSTGLSYDLQVDVSTGNFSSPIIDQTSISNLYYQISGLTPGGEYKWRVRSRNSGGPSATWSSVATFKVAGGLSGGHTVASYPTGNPTVYTQNPTLYWYVEGSSLGLDGFTVKYKKDSAPTWASYNPTSNDASGGKYSITSVNTTYQQITANLEYGAKYYWAVAAVDGSSEGTYSQGSFTVVGNSTSQPVLTSPIGGNTVYTKSPTLWWYVYGSSQGIQNYTIYYSDNNFLSSTDSVTTTNSNTYYQLSNLTAGATYHWKVRGNYSSGYTAWSNTETFVVDPGASPVQPWVGGPNNVKVPTTSPTIAWVLPVQSQSKLSYELEVADNPNFNNPTVIKSDLPFSQVDKLNSGKDYYWRARSKTVNDGKYSNYSIPAHFSVEKTTGVNELGIIPKKFSVKQNYPNPFNPSTIIEFALPRQEFVSVKIYDILGRKIKTLVNSRLNAGIHRLAWRGVNENGAEVSGGVYIYRVTAGSNVVTKKMVLLK